MTKTIKIIKTIIEIEISTNIVEINRENIRSEFIMKKKQ